MKCSVLLCLCFLCLGLTACCAPLEASTLYAAAEDTENVPERYLEPPAEMAESPTEPPILTVTAGSDSIKATRGTTFWNYDAGDGTWSSTVSDSIFPLDEVSRDFLPQLIYETGTAELIFSTEPQSVEVTYWHAVHWGNTQAEGHVLPVENGIVSLAMGSGIYEVTARWTASTAYNGTAHYAFYAAPAEEAPWMIVESGNATVIPFPFRTWSEKWTDNGLLCTDSPSIDTELPRLVSTGIIPSLVLYGALSCRQQDSLTVNRYLLFDESFAAMEDTSPAGLEALAPGTYYIGIEAVVLTQFVSAVESYDCEGYVFIFQLTVEE